MGVGKTAQAIGALDETFSRRAIIVCPAAVREVWRGEFHKFARIPRKILKAKNVHDLGTWLKGRADVMLLSYELASRWAKHVEASRDVFEAIVFDEAHYLKGRESQRSRNMLGTQFDGASGLARMAARAWFLTGTPMANDPMDIWTWLRFVGGTSLGPNAFMNRYFRMYHGAYSSKAVPRDEMVPELKMAIEAFRIKRTAEDVGLQLPPVHLTTITVDGDTREIAELLREWPGLEQDIVDAINAGGLSFLDSQHIATLRRLVGEAKAPAYAKLIAEEFKDGLDKLVIFTWHKRAAEIIASSLLGDGFHTTLVDGSTSDDATEAAIRSFQNDPEHRGFVVNMKKGGTGLTLTAAAAIDLFEQSWSPADNAQAIFRVRRIGQERKVRARLIGLANSIDETVSAAVGRKTASIAKIENYREEAA